MFLGLSTLAQAQSWFRWIGSGAPPAGSVVDVSSGNWQAASTDVTGANPYFCLPARVGNQAPITYYIGFSTGPVGSVSCFAARTARNIAIPSGASISTEGSSFIIPVNPVNGQMDPAGETSANQMGRLTVSYTQGLQQTSCVGANSVVEFRYYLIQNLVTPVARRYDGPACVVRSTANGAQNRFVYTVPPELGSEIAIQQAGADRYRWFVDMNPSIANNWTALPPPVQSPPVVPASLIPELYPNAPQNIYGNSITLNLTGITLPIRLSVVPGWCQASNFDPWRLQNRERGGTFFIDEVPNVRMEAASVETVYRDGDVNPTTETPAWFTANWEPGATTHTRVCIPTNTLFYAKGLPWAAPNVQTNRMSSPAVTSMTVHFRMNAPSNNYQYAISNVVGSGAVNIVPSQGGSLTGQDIAVSVASGVTSFELNVTRENDCGRSTHVIAVYRSMTMVNTGSPVGGVIGPGSNAPRFSPFGAVGGGWDNTEGLAGSGKRFGQLTVVGGNPTVCNQNPPIFIRPDGLSKNRYEVRVPGTGAVVDASTVLNWRIILKDAQDNILQNLTEQQVAAFGIQMAAPANDPTRIFNTREIVWPRSLRSYAGLANLQKIEIVAGAPEGCNNTALSYILPPEMLPGQTEPFAVDANPNSGYPVTPITERDLVIPTTPRFITGTNTNAQNIRYSWYRLGTTAPTFSGNRNAINPAPGGALWGFASPTHVSDVGVGRPNTPVDLVNRPNEIVNTTIPPSTGQTVIATAEPVANQTTVPCFFWAGEVISAARRRPNAVSSSSATYKPVKATLRVSPNPGHGQVQIHRTLLDPAETGKAVLDVIIIGRDGTQLGQAKFSTDEGALDVSGLKPGTYSIVDLGTGATTQLVIN